MARTQQDWFSIFDYHRRIMEERLALLYRFEQFLQQLPAAEYTECLVQNSSTDICSRRIQKVAKKKCRCLQQCRKTNAS